MWQFAETLLRLPLLGKALIPKEEKVVDYHEMHVIGLVLTKPNSINGLPPFTIDRNQVLTVNSHTHTHIHKKNKEFFCCCNPKERKREPTRVGRHRAREIKQKAKWVIDPLNFKGGDITIGR